MKQKSIARAYPIVAQMMAGASNVKLMFDNRGDARTNGKVIFVPLLKSDAKLAEPMLGYIAHECGHVRYTDISVMTQQAATQVEAQLLNALEDARIERKMCELYKGAGHYIRSMNVHMGFQDAKVRDDDRFNLFSYMHLRSMVALVPQCYDMVTCVDDLGKAVVAGYSQGFKIRLDALLDTLPDIDSTYGVLKLARKILEAVEDEAKKAEQDSADNQDGQDSQDAQGGSPGNQGGQGGQDSGQGDQDSGQSDQGDQGDQDSGQQKADSSTKGDASDQTGKGSGNNGFQEFLDSDEKLYTDKGEHFMQDNEEQVSEQSEDLRTADAARELNTGRLPVHQPGAPGVIDAISATVKASSSSMRQTMQRLLEAKMRSKRGLATSGRRLKRGKVHRLGVYDTRVFATEQKQKGIDTAVQLLVDMSGSMRGQREDIAKDAMRALALSVKPLRGIKLAMSAFGDGYTQIKGFNEPYEKACINSVRSGGSTPMAEGMMYAATSLATESATRHVMVIITDGDPDNAASVRFMKETLERHGVEIIAIGIELNSIRGLFDRSVVINDVADLPNVLLNEIGRLVGINVAA